NGEVQCPRCREVTHHFVTQVLPNVASIHRDIGEPQTGRANGSEPRRVRPSVSVTTHRSSWTGRAGQLPFLARALPQTENQPLAKHNRHAVHTANGSPAASASSARYRYPNSGSSARASKRTLAR